MFEKSKVVVVAVVSREFFPLSLSLSLFHSFSFVSTNQPSTLHSYPASLNASMMNAQAAPILKAFSSLSLRLLVDPALAYTNADATS